MILVYRGIKISPNFKASQRISKLRMKLHFSTSDGQQLLFFVLCALINHVFATELPNARKTIRYQPPGDIENRHNTGQRLKKHDSKRNMTVDILAPKSNKMVTSRRQYEEARQSATRPAQLQAMYASRLKRIRRDNSSDQYSIGRKKDLFALYQRERSTISPETGYGQELDRRIEKEMHPERSSASLISINKYNTILSKFPEEFQDFLSTTSNLELELLLGYVLRGGDRDFLEQRLQTYNHAKLNEREKLRTLITNDPSGAEAIIANCKSLRNGVAWDHVKHNELLSKFFEEPSALRTEYETLKKDEIESIDSYLGVKLQQTEGPISAAQLGLTTSGSTNSTLGGSQDWIKIAGIIGGADFVIAGIGIAIFFITRHFRNKKDNKTPQNIKNEQTPLRSMSQISFIASSIAKPTSAKTSKSTHDSKAVK